MGEFEGQVAIVTGAASGIGAATARALADEGAAVVVADVNADGAGLVAKEIAADGGRALPVAVDVEDEAQVEEMVTTAIREYGGLDVLHNCAALQSPEVMARDGAITDIDPELWDRVFRVNLRGYVLGTKHALPHMLERGRGVVINTASGTGLVGELTRPAYGSTKAAIIGFTRQVATQYGQQGIRCVAIAPGLVTTPGLQANLPPEALGMLTGHHLLPELARPEDIAEVVVFLASDRARFITGCTIPVDMGFTSHTPSYSDERTMAAAMAGAQNGARA